MTSRTLPRFVSTMTGNSPQLVAERVVAACADQSANPRAAFAVMMDHKRRVWIDRPEYAIPEEWVCCCTRDSEPAWLAEELAGELLKRTGRQ